MGLRLTTETAKLDEMHETWHSCTYAFRYVASLDRPIQECRGSLLCCALNSKIIMLCSPAIGCYRLPYPDYLYMID